MRGGNAFQDWVCGGLIKWKKEPFVLLIRFSKFLQSHLWLLDWTLGASMQRCHKPVTFLDLQNKCILQGQLTCCVISTVKAHTAFAMVSLEMSLFVCNQPLLCELVGPAQSGRLQRMQCVIIWIFGLADAGTVECFQGSVLKYLSQCNACEYGMGTSGYVKF